MKESSGIPGPSSQTVSGVVLTEAEAQAAVDRADAARRAIQRQIDEEVRAAKALIEEAHNPALRAATDEWLAAKMALVAARDATPDHPWTGKRVFRLVGRGRSWERLPPKREEGIVETFRSTSPVPANMSVYGRPAIGSGIVRHLKKDGSPGTKFDQMRGEYHGWKLVEEDTSDRRRIPGMEESS